MTVTPSQSGGAVEPVDEHAHEAVERDLDHDAAHQRRDVRRARAGARAAATRAAASAPALAPKPISAATRDERAAAPTTRASGGPPSAPCRGEHKERDPGPGTGHVRHGDVDEDRARRARSSSRQTRMIAAGTSVISSQAREEREDVAGAQHEREHGDERAGQRADGAAASRRVEVAARRRRAPGRPRSPASAGRPRSGGRCRARDAMPSPKRGADRVAASTSTAAPAMPAASRRRPGGACRAHLPRQPGRATACREQATAPARQRAPSRLAGASRRA